MMQQKSILPYAVAAVVLAYLGNRLVHTVVQQNPITILTLFQALNRIGSELRVRPLFFCVSEQPCLLGGLAGVVLSCLCYCYFVLAAPARRPGEEHGSAQWGNLSDAKKYRSKEMSQDIILSQHVRLTLHPEELPFDRRKNCNVLIAGGSGSGKSYSSVLPNLMQLHSSYVITDPKGTLLPQTAALFLQNGYQLKVFNTVNFQKSMHYNPLAYIKHETDILKVVTVLMENTTGKGERSGEKFWIDSEKLLYQAYIGYLLYAVPPEDRTLGNLVAMVDASEVREDDPTFQNAIDVLFEDLEHNPDHGGSDNFAVRQYKKFKLAAGKTARSILVSCAARLSAFAIPAVTDLVSEDELNLGQLGDQKTALFIIVSDTDNTFDFLVAMVLSQMFNILCSHADDDCGGALKIPVRCMLDEFANCIGKIPNFERLISTIRSRNISVSLYVQSLAQIQSLYKDDADTIIDCCDTMVFLGGKSQKTTKAISEMLGKQTITGRNTTENRGSNGSYSLQDQGLGRDLLDMAEIGKIPMQKELVLMTGEKPFLDQKYNTAQHPNYKNLQRNGFDVAQYLRQFRQQSNAMQDAQYLMTHAVDLSELNQL